MRWAIRTILLGTVLVSCSKSDPSGPPPPSQTPANLQAAAGDGQSATAGGAVPIRPAVRVTDAEGQPVRNVSVSFAITGGGGTVSGSPATSDANGVATVGSWILGSAPGSNELTAQVGSLPSVTFTATGVSGFNIELRYLTSATNAQRQAFNNAVARWMSIVVGDLSDMLVTAQPGQCGGNSPDINETVDDLLILVTLEPIDGPGGVLGTAGPCFIRLPSNLPVLGQMRFDTGDLAVLETSGDLENVILHEMGHVLGIGTLWDTEGYLADPSQQGGTDPHFTGSLAVSAFDAVGGTSYTGAKVPVENTGGTGTADGHWRESVFDAELMTGFIEPAQTNPLSIVTIASLEDHGFVVSEIGADAYSLGASPIAGSSPASSQIVLGDDRWLGPVYGIDLSGTVNVVRP